jgi:hypothetical protein
MPRHMSIKRRMALLEAWGLDQPGAETVCNTVELDTADGGRIEAPALCRENGSLASLVKKSTWLAVAAEAGAAGRRHPRGLALVQWADAKTHSPSCFGSVSFVDDAGTRVTPESAIQQVRAAVGASRATPVHQLVLLGGRGFGASLLHACAAASGVDADDLLYASAAHVPTATKYLWEEVYVRRFGFTRVPSLRSNLEDPHDEEEAHEIPMVIRMRDLRAADPVVQLRSTRCARAQDAARDRGCGDAAAAAAAALCGGVPVLRGA